MLHTPDNIPLFSTAIPTSLPMSCGDQDRLVIQRPASDTFSFDWSDFPVIQQQDVREFFPSYPSMFSKNDNISMSRRDDLSSASFDSLISTSSSSTSSTASSTSNKRTVSFSDNIKVRTHSVVLGDHPCCKSLPLELGWEYDEDEVRMKDKRKRSLRRMSYLERKDVLKRISGMTDAEIKQIVTSKLRSVAPSSRNLSSLNTSL